MQKRDNFWQSKEHNSGGKRQNYTNEPGFFSSTFWALTACDIHFCIWKLSKFIFMRSALWSILVCKIPEFWRWKLRNQNVFPFDSGNMHIEKSKKPGFTFSIGLRINSKISRAISWSNSTYPYFIHHLMTILLF